MPARICTTKTEPHNPNELKVNAVCVTILVSCVCRSYQVPTDAQSLSHPLTRTALAAADATAPL